MQQIIEVTLDVPEGWVCVGRRPPKQGEFILLDNGAPYKADRDFLSVPYFIIEPDWQWPNWIKSGTFLWQNHFLDWCLSQTEPSLDYNHAWCLSGKSIRVLDLLEVLNVEFSPPPCSDWKKSLRRKP